MIRTPQKQQSSLREKLVRSDFMILVCGLLMFLLAIDRKVAPPIEWRTTADSTRVQTGSSSESTLAPDPENGKALFSHTCTSCHGAQAQGLPHQGVDLRHSKFVSELSDSQLASFLKVGRQPKDPKSQRGMLMPALGGNPSLIDLELVDIVAYLRQVQKQTTGSPAYTSVGLGSAGGSGAQETQ